MKQTVVIPALIFSLWIGAPAFAADQDKCVDALVVSTYNKFQTSHIDWRLATLVTESQYDQIKHDAGASAVIYGVPVSANYSDFHSSATQKLNSHQESLTQDEFLNVLWTGLDSNSVTAYSNCLKAEVFSQDGLHMAVKVATQTDITVLVHWQPTRNDPAQFAPSWTWNGKGLNKLPHQIHQGTTIVVLPRPSNSQQLVVNYNGAADSVIIEPLVTVAPKPLPDPNASLVVDGNSVNIDFATKNRGQRPGCACGDLNVTFPDSPYKAVVGEPFRVRYDASSMCRGQGFDRFRGKLDWDGKQSTTLGNANSATLPGIAGTVVASFSKAGDYNVLADITVDCLDIPSQCPGGRNTCRATGNTNVHIGGP